MAATASEKKLLIAGEWVETGDWVEVRSPYSGEPRRAGGEGGRRGNAARGRRSGGGDARAAAGAQAGGDPRPRRRPARPPPRGGRADDRGRGGKAAQGSARRGVACDVHVHVRGRRGAQARGRDGADGRVAGGRRQARVHRAAADRRRRRDLALQLPAQPRRAQDRACRSQPAAPSCSSRPRRRPSRHSCSPS